MLNNQKKSITLTAESVITVTEGDTTKQVSVEGYSCTISSENPENIPSAVTRRARKERSCIRSTGSSAARTMRHSRMRPMCCRMR